MLLMFPLQDMIPLIIGLSLQPLNAAGVKILLRRLKKTVHIPVIAANLIRSPEQAEQQLEDGIQDFYFTRQTSYCRSALV